MKTVLHLYQELPKAFSGLFSPGSKWLNPGGQFDIIYVKWLKPVNGMVRFSVNDLSQMGNNLQMMATPLPVLVTTINEPVDLIVRQSPTIGEGLLKSIPTHPKCRTITVIPNSFIPKLLNGISSGERTWRNTLAHSDGITLCSKLHFIYLKGISTIPHALIYPGGTISKGKQNFTLHSPPRIALMGDSLPSSFLKKIDHYLHSYGLRPQWHVITNRELHHSTDWDEYDLGLAYLQKRRFPDQFLAAMAAGLPLVANEPRDFFIIEWNRNVVKFTTSSPASMAEGLLHMLQDGSLRQKKSLLIRDYYKRYFDPQMLNEQWTHFLKQLT